MTCGRITGAAASALASTLAALATGYGTTMDWLAGYTGVLAMVKEWWVLTEVNILTGNFYPDEPVDEVRGRVGRRRRRG